MPKPATNATFSAGKFRANHRRSLQANGSLQNPSNDTPPAPDSPPVAPLAAKTPLIPVKPYQGRKIPSMTRLTVQQIADFYGLTDDAVLQWIAHGCPQAGKMPGSKGYALDLYEVQRWRAAKEAADTPAKLRTEEERYRKLKLENDETEGLRVDRREMEAILRSRMRSLRNFFERGFPMNRPHRAMKTVEELASIDRETFRSAMEAYFGSPGWEKEI